MAILAFLRPGSRTVLLAIALVCGGQAHARAPQDTAPLRLRASTAVEQAAVQPDPWLQRWWGAFDDPLLTRLIEAGVAADPELANAAPQADQGKNAKRLFSAKRADRVNAALYYAAVYELAQRKAAKADQIARAYFRVRETQGRMAVANQSLASQQDNIKTASARFRAGLAPAYDGNFARTQSATTTAALGTAEVDLQRDLARLGELTGIETQALRESFGTHLPVQAMPPLPPQDQGGVLALRRADILALEQRLRARLMRDGVAQAKVDAVLAGQARTEASETAGAVQEYANALGAAQADVAVALETVQAARKRVQTLERAVESARIALGDTRMAYDSGLDRFVSVYVAESALFDVRQALVAAQRAEADAFAVYFTALGGGWQIDPAAAAEVRAHRHE